MALRRQSPHGAACARRSRSITCTVPGNFGKAKAEIDSACSLGALDLAEWLVENGWARAKSDGHYAAIEAKARDARKGVWAIAGAASLGDDAPVNPTPSPDDLPAPPQ